MRVCGNTVHVSTSAREDGGVFFPWRRLSACRLDTRVESCAPPVTKRREGVSTWQPERLRHGKEGGD